MFKELTKGCMPTMATKYSACVDVYASEDVVIGAGETKMIGLGVVLGLDQLKSRWSEDWEVSFTGFLETHYLQLALRSSLGKKGLILPNGIGIIDLDYADEIKMIIHNAGFREEFSPSKYEHPLIQEYLTHINADISTAYLIMKGNRIGQIMLCEHKTHLFGIKTEDERTGGFGSTGSN